MDDKTALEDMRQGGNIGFETLYKRYFPRLNALLVKKYNHLTPDTVDDICQHAFSQFLQKIDIFEEKCSVITWLFRVAQNKLIDDWRKEPKTENLPLESLEEEESFFVFDEQEEKRFCYAECIGHALKRLSTHDADCLIVLIFLYQGSSIEDIAKEIGMTDKKAKVLFNRCQRQLKKRQSCLTVYMLFYKLGLSQKEMAEMLGKKENAIGAFLFDCRKKLKNDASFKRCCEDCGYLLPKEKDDVNER